MHVTRESHSHMIRSTSNFQRSQLAFGSASSSPTSIKATTMADTSVKQPAQTFVGPSKQVNTDYPVCSPPAGASMDWKRY